MGKDEEKNCHIITSIIALVKPSLEHNSTFLKVTLKSIILIFRSITSQSLGTNGYKIGSLNTQTFFWLVTQSFLPNEEEEEESSSSLGRKDCVTSQKNVCVGGYKTGVFSLDVTISGSSALYIGSVLSFHTVSGAVASASVGNQWIAESLKMSL